MQNLFYGLNHPSFFDLKLGFVTSDFRKDGLRKEKSDSLSFPITSRENGFVLFEYNIYDHSSLKVIEKGKYFCFIAL